MIDKNPYEILGVSPSASDDQIREAYRTLAKKYHPDQYVGNPLEDVAKEKMQEINAAYDLINTPEKRRAFDYRNNSYQRNQTNQGYNGQQYYSPYQQNNGAYYGRNSNCLSTLGTLCILDSCCECMGGDLCVCC